jgi:hypothetical protein
MRKGGSRGLFEPGICCNLGRDGDDQVADEFVSALKWRIYISL